MGVQTRDSSEQGCHAGCSEDKVKGGEEVGNKKDEVCKEISAGEEVHICQKDKARQEISKGSVTSCQA